VKLRAHYLVMDLPHSDGVFVKIFPSENTESFLEGHVAAFEYFGGVPTKITYDNTKIAVKHILQDGRREVTEAFAMLQSHYLFDYNFCRPAQGHEKGSVEGRVGFCRRSYMVPIPRASSWEELNADFLSRAEQLKKRRVRGQEKTVGERMEDDLATMLPLPATPLEACRRANTSVSSQLLVRFDNNDYSVPRRYAYHGVLVKGFVHRVEIYYGTEKIAEHARLHEKEDVSLEPLHYLSVLEEKIGALDQAAPLQGWNLPKCFERLRHLLETRLQKQGKREYIQVLRLLEQFSELEVQVAIEEALRLGTISYDAVKILVLALIDKRVPKLDIDNYPHLPVAQVKATSAKDYLCLLGSAHAAMPEVTR